MNNYDLLVRTSDAAFTAREFEFENFASALDDITIHLIQELKRLTAD